MSAPGPRNEIALVLTACRRPFVTAAAFSLAINLLYLAAPLYMMQVYDRVIASGSEMTLLLLTLVLLVAFLALAALDAIRSRLLTRASMRIDRLLAPRVVQATLEAKMRSADAGHASLREFDTFRQFITGPGIHAVFDLPWAAIYILLIFCLHPLLGAFALVSVGMLITMALANEWWTRPPLEAANAATAANYRFTESSLRNWQAARAMGMLSGLLLHWLRDRNQALASHQAASERAAVMAAVIRFLRLAMQSVILGLGAYLVIRQSVTIGAIFAASILLGRGLQPFEQIVGAWRGLVGARSAYERVRALLMANPLPTPRIELPRPSSALAVEDLAYVLPGMNRPLLHSVNFRVRAGEALCILGASGAGKSTLAHLLVGVRAPAGGAVRLDDADIRTWPQLSLAPHIGFLPQDVQLFDATVAENISRFGPLDEREIIRAARLAGVHEMILRLPDGYATQVGDGGTLLSGGCRQRIGLARAVYGAPSLVVLDEPSSNLDAAGDWALAQCIDALKDSGTMIVMISHRPATIELVDSIMVLKNGTTALWGRRDQVLARLSATAPRRTAEERQLS